MQKQHEKGQITFLWEKIKRSLKESFSQALEKSEELTRLGRLKLEILQINQQIEKLFAELGGYAYHEIKSGTTKIAAVPRIQQLVEEIEKLEEELQAKESELERIENEEGIDFS